MKMDVQKDSAERHEIYEWLASLGIEFAISRMGYDEIYSTGEVVKWALPSSLPLLITHKAIIIPEGHELHPGESCAGSSYTMSLSELGSLVVDRFECDTSQVVA